MSTLCFALVLFSAQIIRTKEDSPIYQIETVYKNSYIGNTTKNDFYGIDLNQIELFKDDNRLYRFLERSSPTPVESRRQLITTPSNIPGQASRTGIASRQAVALAVAQTPPSNHSLPSENYNVKDYPKNVYHLMVAPNRFKIINASDVRFIKTKPGDLSSSGLVPNYGPNTAQAGSNAQNLPTPCVNVNQPQYMFPKPYNTDPKVQAAILGNLNQPSISENKPQAIYNPAKAPTPPVTPGTIIPSPAAENKPLNVQAQNGQVTLISPGNSTNGNYQVFGIGNDSSISVASTGGSSVNVSGQPGNSKIVMVNTNNPTSLTNQPKENNAAVAGSSSNGGIQVSASNTATTAVNRPIVQSGSNQYFNDKNTAMAVAVTNPNGGSQVMVSTGNSDTTPSYKPTVQNGQNTPVNTAASISTNNGIPQATAAAMSASTNNNNQNPITAGNEKVIATAAAPSTTNFSQQPIVQAVVTQKPFNAAGSPVVAIAVSGTSNNNPPNLFNIPTQQDVSPKPNIALSLSTLNLTPTKASPMAESYVYNSQNSKPVASNGASVSNGMNNPQVNIAKPVPANSVNFGLNNPVNAVAGAFAQSNGPPASVMAPGITSNTNVLGGSQTSPQNPIPNILNLNNKPGAFSAAAFSQASGVVPQPNFVSSSAIPPRIPLPPQQMNNPLLAATNMMNQAMSAVSGPAPSMQFPSQQMKNPLLTASTMMNQAISLANGNKPMAFTNLPSLPFSFHSFETPGTKSEESNIQATQTQTTTYNEESKIGFRMAANKLGPRPLVKKRLPWRRNNVTGAPEIPVSQHDFLIELFKNITQTNGINEDLNRKILSENQIHTEQNKELIARNCKILDILLKKPYET